MAGLLTRVNFSTITYLGAVHKLRDALGERGGGVDLINREGKLSIKLGQITLP